MLVVSHSLPYLILITLLSEQLIYFKHVMLWPLVVQDNFDFMRHNVSGNFGNCRWNMADDKASSRSDRRENYKWKVSKLVRTVIVKWCKEIIERCFAIFVKLKYMRVYRLLKVSTFASRAPLHSCTGPRGLSSIGFLSRLFGASPSEPRPKKDPRYQTVHGLELRDDFHWLKERGSKVRITEKFPQLKIGNHQPYWGLPNPTPLLFMGLLSFWKWNTIGIS